MSAEELRPEVAMWVPTCEVARAVGVDEKTVAMQCRIGWLVSRKDRRGRWEVAIDWDGCPVYGDDL